MICNGMLAGLVAITAPCAFVNASGAVLIGLLSGVMMVGAVYFVERVLKIDDPVGALAVHGVNGAFGVLAIGLFANGDVRARAGTVCTPSLTRRVISARCSTTNPPPK